MVAVPSAIKVFNWLGTHAQRLHPLRCADALCAGLHRPVHHRRPDRAVRRRARRRRPSARRPISWSRISTTSWSAAWSRPSLPGCIIGGRRSPAGCIRRCGAALAALIIFIGFNLTFFPQFILGYLGMPRRYHSYPPEFQVLNVLSSAGATILAAGYLLPLVYLTWSLFCGERAPANPWDATGLEWQTPSPPLTENFVVTPVVTEAALQLSAARGRAAVMSEDLAAARVPIFERRSIRPRRRSPACGCSWPPKCCSSARLFLSWIYCRHWNQAGFDAGAQQTELCDRHDQHRHPGDQQLCLCAGLAFIEAGQQPPADPVLRRRAGARRGISDSQIRARVARRFRQAPVSPCPTSRSQGPLSGGARLFFVFYFVSTALHGVHMIGGLVWSVDHPARPARRVLAASITRR